MSDFKKCCICKNYSWFPGHKCFPRWKVFHKEYLGEDYDTIYAIDYKEAAKEYGKLYDSGDYYILNGEEITIQVEPITGGERKTFIITGETEPIYYATEKK